MAENALRTPEGSPVPPRRRFLDALPERLSALGASLDALLAEPTSTSKRQTLSRRLDAMADAAQALGLSQLAPAFISAQSALERAGNDPTDRAFEDVREILALVPSLCPAAQAMPESARTPVIGDGASQAGQPANLEPEPPSTETLEPTVAASKTAHSTAESAEYTLQVPEPGRTADARQSQPVLAPRRPTTVIALGVLALREQVRAWQRSAPQTPFEFTVDLEDARDLASCEETPLFIVDARRRDAQRAVSTLSQLGLCLAVEATAEQAASWRDTRRLSVATTAEEAIAHISSTLRGSTPLDVEEPPRQPPEVAMRQQHNTRRQSPNTSTLPNRRVLIADADPATAWFLSGVLKAARAEVLEAKDGLEAWSIAQRWYPDLIVADMSLDGLDGFGLCRNVKRDVALADIPLMLLARKREQLHRARELGARADAYLVKEAHAPLILKRCTEVLQSRADVEQRIRSERSFRGRLDGMTPHTVLRLTCELVGSASVTFEDAGYEFVASVADGRLFNVERRLPGGGRQHGAGAAAALLGMRAGSFRIERGCESPQAEFSGSLSHALAPTLERTRRAMRVLQGDALNTIARLEIHRSNATPYIESSPAVVKKIVAKLQAGVAPAALLRSISPGLLESVLTDLALRGGIERAISRNGSDLLEDHDVFAQPFDLDLRTPTGGFEMVAAPGAPLVDRHSSYEDALEAAAFARDNAAALDENLPADAAPHDVNVRPNPGQSDVFVAPLAEQPDEVDPDAHRTSHSPEAQAAGSANFDEREIVPMAARGTPASAHAPHTTEALEHAADLGPSAAALKFTLNTEHAPEAELTPHEASPASADGPPTSGDLDLGLAVFSATSATPSTLPPHAKPQAGKTTKEICDTPRDPAPQPAATSDSTNLESRAPASTNSEPTPAPNTDVASSNELAATVDSEAPRARRATDELLLSDSLTESQRLPAIDLEADDDPLFDSLVAGRGFADSSSVNLSPVLPRGRKRNSSQADEPDENSEPDDAKSTFVRNDQSRVATTPSLKRPPERPAAERNTFSDRMGNGAKRAAAFAAFAKRWLPQATDANKTRRTTEAQPAIRQRAIDVSRVAKRTVLPIVAVVGAATLTFTGMGVIVDRLQSAKSEPPEMLEPVDGIAAHPATLSAPDTVLDDSDEQPQASVAPPGSKSKTTRVEMTTIDLPLPSGIEVGEDKGLLEINSAGKHKIYVEGVFVGRGPVRRVPLQAGAHKVTMRKDGDETTSEVVVTSGRRVRLEPRALATAPSPH